MKTSPWYKNKNINITSLLGPNLRISPNYEKVQDALHLAETLKSCIMAFSIIRDTFIM